MQKKILVAGGLLVVLIVLLLLMFLGGGGEVVENTPREDASNTTPEVASPQPFAGAGTLEDLVKRGENIECAITFAPNEYEAPIEGTYFVADGRVRGDFLIPSPDMGGTVLSSIIMAENMMYTWSEIEGELFGIKMSLDTSTQPGGVEQTPPSSQQPIAMDAAVQFDCKPWGLVDNTVFEPPRTVLFRDVNEMMRGGMEDGTIYLPGEMMPE